MLRRFLVFLCLALAAAFPGPAASSSLQPGPEYADICQRLAYRLPHEHLLRFKLDDTISSRTWTNFLSALDPDKVYFLQSDIAEFQATENSLDDMLRLGESQFAFDVFDVFKSRVSNRVAYVETLLAQGFNTDLEEFYRWQRKDSPWSADRSVWDDLWRKRIKNEYVRLIVDRELGLADDDELHDGGTVTNDVWLSRPATATVDSAIGDLAPAPSLGDPGAATNRDAVVDMAPEPEKTPEELILNRYTQTHFFFEDIDPEWILQKYLTAFAQAYDPHSSYLPKSALEDFKIEMKLSLVGIGAVLRAQDGAAEIVRLIPGGPADSDKREQRLQPRDRIVAVAQDTGKPVDILHWPLHRIVQQIRGEKGTRVVLTVIPASDPSGAATKKVDLIRDEVKLEQQAASSRVRESIADDGTTNTLGVIRLPAFYGNMQVDSPEDPEFRSAVYDVRNLLWDMQKKQVKGILLDLRNNGGGSLTEAVDMTGLFIHKGPAARVQSRFGVRTLYDRDPSLAFSGPMVVLVNRLSASASEILTGALQDYGRAVIVGDSKTHGKGSVQGLLGVSDISDELGALKVTNAAWYRISGKATQLHGVTPDIIIPSPWDYIETGESFLQNSIEWPDVRPAVYRPVNDLSGILPTLRGRSEQRRQEDAAFQNYAKLLERIGTMNRSGVLPLNLDERRHMAETEKELSDLQERLAEANDIGDTNAVENVDLVLAEGLTILADLVRLQPASTSVEVLTGPDPEGIKRSLREWLRDNL